MPSPANFPTTTPEAADFGAAPPAMPVDGAVANAPRERILDAARERFFSAGYSTLTMDDLAGDLGMSKKTVYAHFSSKDALLLEVVERFSAGIRAEAEVIFNHRQLNVAEKLRGFIGFMMERLSRVTPVALRDIQRHAPVLHARIEELRRRNLPFVFGRLIEEGQAARMVRADLNVALAVEFLLHGLQGIMNPANHAHLHLAPRDLLAQSLEVFFGGLLTPSGRQEYERLFPH